MIPSYPNRPRCDRIAAAARAGILAVALPLTGACDVIDPSGPDHDLAFEGRAALVTTPDGDAIEAVLSVTNGGAEMVHFSWGGCRGALVLALYDDPGREGRPSWDSGAPIGAVCTLELVVRAVAPGETAEFSTTIPVARIFDEGAVPGRYYLTVAPDFAAPILDGPELPTGDIVVDH